MASAADHRSRSDGANHLNVVFYDKDDNILHHEWKFDGVEGGHITRSPMWHIPMVDEEEWQASLGR